jgi:hypothetical protein
MMKVLHVKTLLTTMNPKKMMSNIATHYCFFYRGNTKKKTMTSSFSSSFSVAQCKVFLKNWLRWNSCWNKGWWWYNRAQIAMNDGAKYGVVHIVPGNT